MADGSNVRNGGSAASAEEASARVRLPAWAWHLERQFGKKIPQCVNCGSHNLWENHARASWTCGDCRMELSDSFGIRWVPADPNARQPDEEHKPEGMWFDRFQREVRRV